MWRTINGRPIIGLELKGLRLEPTADNLCETPCKWVLFSSLISHPLNDVMRMPVRETGAYRLRWDWPLLLLCFLSFFPPPSLLSSPPLSLWCHWRVLKEVGVISALHAWQIATRDTDPGPCLCLRQYRTTFPSSPDVTTNGHYISFLLTKHGYQHATMSSEGHR